LDALVELAWAWAWACLSMVHLWTPLSCKGAISCWKFARFGSPCKREAIVWLEQREPIEAK